MDYEVFRKTYFFAIKLSGLQKIFNLYVFTGADMIWVVLKAVKFITK